MRGARGRVGIALVVALSACGGGNSTTSPRDAAPDRVPVAEASPLNEAGPDVADASVETAPEADAALDAVDAPDVVDAFVEPDVEAGADAAAPVCHDADPDTVVGAATPACALPVYRPPDLGGVADAPDTRTLTFVVSHIDFGVADCAGYPTPDAWKTIGFDLDCDMGQPTSFGATCQPIVPGEIAEGEDGVAGIDNSFGRNIVPALVKHDPTFQSWQNARIQSGHWSIGVELTLGDGATDGVVTIRTGTVSMKGVAPKWDGTDVWYRLSVTSTTTGTLRDGVLGAERVVVNVPLLGGNGYGYGALGFASTMVARFDVSLQGSNDVIVAGSASANAIFNALRGGRCSAPVVEPAPYLDLRGDDQDAGAACSAISVGLRLELARADHVEGAGPLHLPPRITPCPDAG